MNSDKYLLLLTLITLLSVPTQANAPKRWNISAIFAFGDSTLDAGNNNNRPTMCRCNHRPYGMSLRNKVPTGRFSDGKLALDFVISALGIKNLLPAYSDTTTTNEALLTGVSFASGCAGLDDLTAIPSGSLTMTMQLRHFQEAFDRIRGLVGQEKAGQIIENSLFVINVGTNDVMYNLYMMPMGSMRSVAEYHDLLLRNLETIVKRLVSLGAARLAVMGMPPVGCLPLMVTMNSMNSEGMVVKRECSASQNADAQAYNKKLQSLITRLTATLRRSRIVYGGTYNPIMDIIRNSTKYRFERTHEGCCGTGALETGPMCNANSALCRNPSKYLFWDAVHPTQATNKIYAKYFQDKVLPILMS